jgi:hypothetical protein
MSHVRHEPIWPFLAVLFCLFILSATAPRAWERVAEDQGLRRWKAAPGDQAKATQSSLPTEPTFPEAGVDPSEPLPEAVFRPFGVGDLGDGLSQTMKTAIQRVGEMQIAAVAPRYGGMPIDPDWSDLQLPAREPVEVPPCVTEPPPLETALLLNEEALPDEGGLSREEIEPSEAVESPGWLSDEDWVREKDWPNEEDQPPAEPQPLEPPSLDPPLELVKKPLTPDPSPRKRGEGSRSWDGFLVDDGNVEGVEGISVVAPEDIPAMAPSKAGSAWDREDGLGRPNSLLAQLDDLAWDCETGPWARAATRLVRLLGRSLSEGSDEAPAIVDRLEESLAQSELLAGRLASQTETEALAGGVRRTRHAMERRLPIWRQAAIAGGLSAVASGLPEVDPADFSACMTAIEKLTADGSAGRSWRQFLATDLLRTMVEQNGEAERESRCFVALEILQRINSSELAAEQRRFVTTGPVAELDSYLRRWISQPVSLGELIQRIERYESDGRPSDARSLAENFLRLEVSPAADHQFASHQLQTHYRDANVRISIAEELINRLIPPREPQCETVRDRVLGKPVYGQSSTSTAVALRMVPDENRLLMNLEVRGLVSSSTSSTTWPATFHNQSNSTYTARKPMELTTSGLHFRATQVSVDSDTRLRGVETEFDFIPLVGPMVQDIARSEHEKNRWEIRREVERKVQYRSERQIDTETEARLGELGNRLVEKIIEPLSAMRLGPVMIRARTTDDRMTMELRLASDEQLGGHTPRPWAPSDSLLSCQIHESALNNFVERLQLDGGTFTLVELRRRIAEKTRRPQIAAVETEQDDVRLTFAARDAVQIRLKEGRIELSLSLVKLQKRPHEWRDFQVLVGYRAEGDGRNTQLVRDGVIQLIAPMNYRSQIALRGIFSKTFPKDRRLDALPQQLATDPRMGGLTVTQLTIEDGWIGLALGPGQSADPASVAGRRTDPVE